VDTRRHTIGQRLERHLWLTCQSREPERSVRVLRRRTRLSHPILGDQTGVQWVQGRVNLILGRSDRDDISWVLNPAVGKRLRDPVVITAVACILASVGRVSGGKAE
jgi:hypothetical protein